MAYDQLRGFNYVNYYAVLYRKCYGFSQFCHFRARRRRNI